MAMPVREAFERATEAFNRHDIKGFAEGLADDVTFTAPGGVQGRGKQACAESYAVWFHAFPDAHVAMRAVHIIDDVVVEEGTFTGTHNGVLHGPAGDVPPTGRAVKVDYVDVLRFKDGKHVSMNLIFDQLELLGQLGLLPAPASAGR